MAQANPAPAANPTAADDDTVLRLSRHFAAAPERVYAAFTQVEQLRKWWGPEGFTCPSAEIDPRPGGRYRFEMRSPEGGVHIVGGEFREVEPPRRLVYSWAWEQGDMAGVETLVTLEFEGRDGGTRFTLTHSLFPDREARDNHEWGWSSSFADLDRSLGARSSVNLS